MRQRFCMRFSKKITVHLLLVWKTRCIRLVWCNPNNIVAVAAIDRYASLYDLFLGANSKVSLALEDILEM